MTSRKIGPFEIEQQLGAGGMGIVYRAKYLKNGQQVALKVLPPAFSADPKLLARFEREMEILKKLRDPNIVQYYGGGRAGTQHFYAMELMDGGSLEELLKKKRRLPWEQAIDIGKQVAKALEHAHNSGIIHRDLKPANLFLGKDGKIKLGDFGIARDTEATALTAAGSTVGTYAYMAPEQISGKAAITRRTDLYALGCLLFEVLTGRTPFEADTMADMLMMHLRETPPRVTQYATDCPVWLETLVSKLMAKDPEDRYFDALAVQVALDEVGKKVAANASVSRQTVVGDMTAVGLSRDDPTLREILKGKKKKKKKKGPIYEQIWFLVLALLVVVAGVAWGMWPPSESALFEKAEKLLAQANATEDNDVRVSTLLEVRDRYLKPMLERFPQGQHAERGRQILEDIEADEVERQAVNKLKFNRDPKSEAERMYVDALRFEQQQDRITALAKYRSLVALSQGNDDARIYLRLAKKKMDEIQRLNEAEGGALKLIRENLRRAEILANRGEKLKADTIWSSIIEVYGSNQEFEVFVQYARARREGRPVAPMEFDAPKASSGGPS